MLKANLTSYSNSERQTTLAFTPNHPMVIGLDRQIGRLNAELADLNEQVRDLPTTQQEVLRLIRDVEVNTVLYTSLLNTAQELRVVKAGTVGNVRVIDYAIQPSSPIRPNKTRMLLLSLLLGGFAGVATAFAKKALRAGVDDPDLIEKQLNIPVYATIPHSNKQDRIFKALQSKDKRREILAVDSPEDAAIESLKNLRTALHFGMMDVKNNCIMIAGPSPTVGKSFVSVNLAAVLTSNDKKVLLIDARYASRTFAPVSRPETGKRPVRIHQWRHSDRGSPASDDDTQPDPDSDRNDSAQSGGTVTSPAIHKLPERSSVRATTTSLLIHHPSLR